MPFLAPVVGAVAGALFGGGLVATLAVAAISVGLQLAVSYLTRPKKRKYSAVQGQVEFGGDIPVTAAYGKVATMGQRVYYAKYGEGNKYNAEVFVLSNGWCDGLEPEIYFYGEKHKLVPAAGKKWVANGNAALSFITQYPLFVEWAGITNPNDALSALQNTIGPGGNWAKFQEMLKSYNGFYPGFLEGQPGLPVGIFDLIKNGVPDGPNAAFGNPDEVWHVQGFGGKIVIRFFSGRPDQGVDQALVADTRHLENKWSSNNTMRGLCYVVVEREWDEELFKKGRPDFKFVLRGLREYDPRYDDTVVGGSGPQRLDDPSTWVWTENPAVHRLNYQLGLRGLVSDRVLIGEGKSLGQLELGSYFTAMNVCDELRNGKPRYACSLIVSGDDDHTEVLKEFDDAMAGYGMNRRGLSGVIAGAPQVPVLTITEDDLRVDEPIDLRRRKSAFDLYNHFSGQFTSPDSHWEPESLTPVYSNADAAADGRVRQIANDFLQVTDADRAQYLLTIRYRQNRKGGSVSLPVSRQVGFAVTEGEWVNYDGKTWLVTGWRCDSEFRVTLELSETGADVYAEEGIDPGPIVVPPPVIINPDMLSTVQGFSVDVGFITNDEGENKPALKFTWTPPNDPTITQVRFEYKINDGLGGDSVSPVITDLTTDPESGEYLTTKGVVGGKVYVARATITTVPDRLKQWTVWVSTPDYTRRSTVTAYLEDFGSDAYALLQQAHQRINALDAKIEQLALAASESVGEQFEERSMVMRFRNATAAFIEETKVSIQEIDGTLTAHASALNYVESKIGPASAGALWSISSTVVEDGDITAEIDFLARANLSEVMTSSGLMIRAGFEGGNPAAPFSEVVVSADKFVVIHEDQEVSPFTIVGGDVYINSALIAELSAEKITAGTLTLQKWAPPTAGDNIILRLGAEGKAYLCWLVSYTIPSSHIIGAHTSCSARDGWVTVDLENAITEQMFRSYFAVGFDVMIGGTIRLKFDLARGGTSGTARARIMLNGVEYDSTSTTSSTSYSADIAVEAGDNITIQHIMDGGTINQARYSSISNVVVCSGNLTPAVA